MRWAAAAGWSAEMGQQILKQKDKYGDVIKIGRTPYKGTPLPRDSVTPLKPPWAMNHPVACRRIFIISFEPGRQGYNNTG